LEYKGRQLFISNMFMVNLFNNYAAGICVIVGQNISSEWLWTSYLLILDKL